MKSEAVKPGTHVQFNKYKIPSIEVLVFEYHPDDVKDNTLDKKYKISVDSIGVVLETRVNDSSIRRNWHRILFHNCIGWIDEDWILEVC